MRPSEDKCPACRSSLTTVRVHGEGAYLLLFALILFTGPGLCFFLFGAVLEAISQRSSRDETRPTGGVK